MKKILKQILITLTVVVFTGCGTGEEGSSSGGKGKLIKIKDLLPEAAKNVLLKTMTSGPYVLEFFYDDKNMLVRATTSFNGSLSSEYTIEYEYNGDGLVKKSTRTSHHINQEYESTSVTNTKIKYKNKRLDTVNTKSEIESMNTESEPTVSKVKVLKRKGSIITEFVTKNYDDDKNLLSTHEYKYEVDKLKRTRQDVTSTYSKHAEKFAGETHKRYITYEYDDTLNTINPIYYGPVEIIYIDNHLNTELRIPSKSISHSAYGTGVTTNTFEFDSNGLMTKRIMNGGATTYKYIDKN